MSVRIYCPNCIAEFVNGLPTHETGCHHSDKAWVKRGKGERKVLIPRDTEVPDFVNAKEEDG